VWRRVGIKGKKRRREEKRRGEKRREEERRGKWRTELNINLNCNRGKSDQKIKAATAALVSSLSHLLHPESHLSLQHGVQGGDLD
jgi:hypothetical protein